MIGLVVTLSPSLKLGDPEMIPVTDPSLFLRQLLKVGTPRGATAGLEAGAVFLGTGVDFFATGVGFFAAARAATAFLGAGAGEGAASSPSPPNPNSEKVARGLACSTA